MVEQMPEPFRIALILAATGGIGGETARALSLRGWKIRVFSRNRQPASESSPVPHNLQGGLSCHCKQYRTIRYRKSGLPGQDRDERHGDSLSDEKRAARPIFFL